MLGAGVKPFGPGEVEGLGNSADVYGCNEFLAGNMLRSAKALDETGVFGYCCRHEFPGKFGLVLYR